MNIKVNFTSEELQTVLTVLSNAIVHSKLNKDARSARLYTNIEDKLVHEFTAQIIDSHFQSAN